MTQEPIKINYDDCLLAHAKVTCNIMAMATQNPVFTDQRVVQNIFNSFRAIRNDIRKELFDELSTSQDQNVLNFAKEFGVKYAIIKQ